MKADIYKNIENLGIKFSDPPSPQGSYSPWVITGKYVYLSGQIPIVEDRLRYKGTVPNEISILEATDAAKICAINLLNQLHIACKGDLKIVKKLVKVTGYVASNKSFSEHPAVINGASDLFKSVFEEKGKHARAAIGCSSLPLGAPVEVEALFEIE